jgi:proline iminopeptidase
MRSESGLAPREGFLPADGARLYYRDIGQGLPVIVLHGGPDFSHDYLLPDLDRLADAFRLISYDQRGRGRSATGVRPEDVSLASEMDDLDALRQHFGLEMAALLGHSWGTVVALEYALRHPDRVSHLILMNPAPASRSDYLDFRQDRLERAAGDIAQMQAIAATTAYQAGDPETVAAYYRIHYRTAVRRPEDVERVVAGLHLSPSNDAILRAWAIEDRLMDETWRVDGYDLLPTLSALHIPTLVIHGVYDFVPVACAHHIAAALPAARFVPIPESGHFSYLERPEETRRAIVDFVQDTSLSP